MVGENIKRLRIRKTNYSQREVAEILGVDRNTYANWENDDADIKSEFLQKLAEIFRVNVGELFESPNDKITVVNNNYEGKDNSILTGAVIILNNQAAVEKFLAFLEQEKKE